MTHYAEAFAVIPGQCFRFVNNGVGHASHCREPVVRRGQLIDGKGGRWQIDAGAEQAEGLN